MALVLLHLFILISVIPFCVLSATYVIPPAWDPVHTNTTILSDEDNDYYIANNGSQDIVSDNGILRMAFAIQYGNGTVRPYATLLIRSNNSQPYVLMDLIDFGDPDVISSIELDDCGTMKFIARNHSLDFYLTPTYLLPMCMMSTKAFYDYVESAFPVQLNLARSWESKGKVTYNELLKCEWIMLFDNGSVSMIPIPPCSLSKTTLVFRELNNHLDEASPILPFLKITDTRVALYEMDADQQTWVVDSILMLNSTCTCPVNMVCDLSGKCNDTLSIGESSEGTNVHLPYLNGNISNDYPNTWTRKGVGLPMRSFKPDLENTTLKSCIQVATYTTFYDQNTGNCYLMDRVPPVSMQEDENMTTFINFGYNHSAFDTNTKSYITIYPFVLGIIMLTIYTLAIIFLPIVKAKLYSVNPAKEVEGLLSTMQGLPQRYSYTELEAATRGFRKKLGAGGFGSIYEGFTRDARHVAVKKLNDNGTESAKQFVTEIAGIGGVSHFNIVKLCGFCIDGASQKLLVYEFMPNSSLDTWLFTRGMEKTLNWEQRFNIALGTARGIFYLHEECSEPILHLDIKPQNILLDGKFEAKVSDFGLAKMLTNRDVTRVETKVRGTPGYMAPEWLVQNAATKKCDVYSYGMLLLELVGGRKNVDVTRINNEDSSWYFPVWVVDRVKQRQYLEVVDTRLGPETPIADVEMLIRIALWCIQDNPVTRPSMGEVLEMLHKQKKVEEPPISFYFDRAEDVVSYDTSTAFSMLLESINDSTYKASGVS